MEAMSFLQISEQILVAVIGILVGAAFTGSFLGFRHLLWHYRKWRYKRNWNPILGVVNSKLEELFESKSLAPAPSVQIKRGDVPVATAQSWVRRKDGLVVPSHSKKRVILVASDDEIKSGSPFDQSIVNLIQEILIMRGDPFLAHLSTDIVNALRRLSMEKISSEFEIDSGVIPLLEDKASEADKLDSLAAIEDMHNASRLSSFLNDVADSYATKTLSIQNRLQTTKEFWSRYSDLEKEFRGLLVKSSEKQINYMKSGLKGLMTPPSFAPPSRTKDWSLFLWTNKEGIVANATIVEFHSDTFENLLRKFIKSILRIEGLSQSETRSLHENWARGLGGITTKARDGRKPRGRALKPILLHLSDFVLLIRPISASTMKELKLPAFSNLVRLTLSQVKAITEYAMPKP